MAVMYSRYKFRVLLMLLVYSIIKQSCSETSIPAMLPAFDFW